MLGNIILLIVGFFFTSLMFYLNHRFVGHGPLGKWPLLHHIKRLHMIHHRNDYGVDRNRHLVLPLWAKLSFITAFLLISLISLPFALGSIAYVLYYGWLHHQMHNDDQMGYFSRHHYIHHRKSARHNFSGTMPFIDKLFGTKLNNP